LSSAFAVAQPMPLEHAGNDSELLVSKLDSAQHNAAVGCLP